MHFCLSEHLEPSLVSYVVLILSHRSVTPGHELHRSVKALEVVELISGKEQLHVC